jgi:hypothetical protein
MRITNIYRYSVRTPATNLLLRPTTKLSQGVYTVVIVQDANIGVDDGWKLVPCVEVPDSNNKSNYVIS